MFVVETTGTEYNRDPHAVLRAARAAGPVERDEFGTPILLRYDDVDAALRDSRFINDYDVLLTRHGITSGPLFDWWKLAMLNTNPPVHNRLRQLANRAFTPRAADATRHRMRELTEHHLDQLPNDEPFDFIEEVTEPLPLTIVCDIIGVPTDDHHTFSRWVAEIGLMFADAVPPENRTIAESAMVNLNEYVVSMIEAKRRAPDHSLMSALISIEEGGDRLSYAELMALVVNLMLGALDTSRSALSIGLWLLVRHGCRSMSAAAVEELLRYEAPSGELRRTAAVDVVIHDVAIDAGTSVGLSVMSANRDAAAFTDPDVFDPNRYLANPRPQLSFGRGSHFCLGNAIARVELHEVLDLLLTRFPSLKIVTDQPQWVPHLRVRHYEEVRVVLGGKHEHGR